MCHAIAESGMKGWEDVENLLIEFAQNSTLVSAYKVCQRNVTVSHHKLLYDHGTTTLSI